ncbi:unnamed protein product [Onchocerca flexuosa]|uniref:Uncharacterized protein n=1 Tax=Onchocerca flexuosa TaxID=387005 RepID=A0A3P7ZFU9_9BILA|nr:unnamed protein product [Onchocerca flexuosa]
MCFISFKFKYLYKSVITDEDGGDNEDEALFTVAPFDDNDEDSSHLIPATYPHHLSLTELTNNYFHYFTEFFRGTITLDSSSMTVSSDRFGVENFADLVAKASKKIRSPSTFIKIAYPTTILPTSLHSVLQPLAKIDSNRYGIN